MRIPGLPVAGFPLRHEPPNAHVCRLASAATYSQCIGKVARLSVVTIALLALAPLKLAAQTSAVQGYSFKIIDDQNATSIFNDGSPSGIYTSPNGVNDSGTVVGDYSAANNTYYGFAYSGGTFTTIGFLLECSQDCGTIPWGINDSGVIVGEADSSSVTVPQIEGFYGFNGSYSLIAFPGADHTAIDGISQERRNGRNG